MIDRTREYKVYEFANGKAIHVLFSDSFDMNSTMVRFQEFYESPHPNINGRRFTLDQYMDTYVYSPEAKEWAGLGIVGWWLRRRNPTCKGFDYFTRVLGTNVPGYSLRDFLKAHTDGDGRHLRQRERALLEAIACSLGLGATNPLVDLENHEEPFYVIGTYRGDRDGKATLKHELAHARYYLDDEYQRQVTSIVMKNWSPALEKALRKRGYADEQMLDEMHAFALTGWESWFPWYKRDRQAKILAHTLRHMFK